MTGGQVPGQVLGGRQACRWDTGSIWGAQEAFRRLWQLVRVPGQPGDLQVTVEPRRQLASRVPLPRPRTALRLWRVGEQFPGPFCWDGESFSLPSLADLSKRQVEFGETE